MDPQDVAVLCLERNDVSVRCAARAAIRGKTNIVVGKHQLLSDVPGAAIVLDEKLPILLYHCPEPGPLHAADEPASFPRVQRSAKHFGRSEVICPSQYMMVFST